MNTGEPELTGLYSAERRVLEIQAKLHRWASDDPHRRFDDLFNLVADPAFLLVAWDRVRGNKGARTAGVDGETAHYIEAVRGVEGFLEELRADLRARTFRPLPVRRRAIPKAGGKVRYLGIATIRDRVAQASLKLVLEPVFEADFLPCSYGFRPNRRAHDAVAEVHHFTSRSYEWIVEGDIKACFDEISHPALMDRVRQRVGDKRVLALVQRLKGQGLPLGWFGFEAESGLGEESVDQRGPVLDALKPVLHDGGQLVRGAAAAEVAEAVFHVRPGTLGRVEVGGVGGQLDDCQPVGVRAGEGAHHGAEVGVQIVPDEDDRGFQLMVRGGDQACVVCFGHAAPLAFAAAVDADPVEEPAPGAGPEAHQAGCGYPPGAFPGHRDDWGVAAAAPGAGLRRPQVLPGLILEAEVRPGRRR